MYCSSCGKAVNQGLSFCNHCGAKANGAIEPAAGKLSESSLNVLLGGTLGIPIAGLGIVIGLMSVMKEMGFSSSLIITVTLLSFLLLLAAEAAFIYTLIQFRTRSVQETSDDVRLKEVVVSGLAEPKVPELAEPIPSVTEYTTRSFEPISRKNKAR